MFGPVELIQNKGTNTGTITNIIFANNPFDRNATSDLPKEKIHMPIAKNGCDVMVSKEAASAWVK